VTKASDNVFPKIIGEEITTPANPSAGERKLYAKSDGWYDLDSAGTETGPLGAGGGGGLTQAYVGKNAIGASNEVFVTRRHYMKSVTLANDCLITSVGAYTGQAGGGAIENMNSFVMADSAGTPTQLLSYNLSSLALNNYLEGAGDYRWLELPIGLWVPAGTYWIGVVSFRTSTVALRLSYDAGADKISTAAGDWIQDGNASTVTDSTKDYSIRANTIR
jgi:hypothetical protein